MLLLNNLINKKLAELILLICIPGLQIFGQSEKNKLIFHDKAGDEIKIEQGSIMVNKIPLYLFTEPAIDYSSKLNRLIESGHSVFLFLVIYGSPNKDRLYGFRITPNKIDSVVDAIASEIKDFDKDGWLEFGGSDVNESHPSEDSMYYLPSAYYEIRNDNIRFDTLLTKKKDIRENGVYLKEKDQLDEKGYCCKVIAKPKKRKVIFANK